MSIEITRAAVRAGTFQPPWMLPLTSDPTAAIRREIELVEHLDRIGFDEAWMGEHHSGGMQLIASPELFVAAAIERTHRIKVGTGVLTLPYHNPLMVADRLVQLDHQAQGRAMFGFGQGLLPADALMLGVPIDQLRPRMAEALDVVLRLIDGDTVTERTAWYDLHEARLQVEPYSLPRPEIAVASALTPSSGKLAGRHDLAMLCVAAGGAAGFQVLDANWRMAEEIAAESDRSMDRSRLRLVAPFHIAPTRDQAIVEVREGFERWLRFQDDALEGSTESFLGFRDFESMLEREVGVVGTVDDAVDALDQYWEKSGGFGCFLIQVTNWANFEDTKRSLRLFANEVLPRFKRAGKRRQESHEWAERNSAAMAKEINASAAKAKLSSN